MEISALAANFLALASICIAIYTWGCMYSYIYAYKEYSLCRLAMP